MLGSMPRENGEGRHEAGGVFGFEQDFGGVGVSGIDVREPRVSRRYASSTAFSRPSRIFVMARRLLLRRLAPVRAARNTKGQAMTTRNLLPVVAMLMGAMALAGCKLPQPPPSDDDPDSEEPAFPDRRAPSSARPGDAPEPDDGTPPRRARRWRGRGHGHGHGRGRGHGPGAGGPGGTPWGGRGGDAPGAPPWGRGRNRGGDDPGQDGPPPGWQPRSGGGPSQGGPGRRSRDRDDDDQGPPETPETL
jgi:hypothetical protein